MEVWRGTAGEPRLTLHQGPPVNHCRPAVDVLFRSVARTFADRALGLVLTGMGSDGLEGARAIVAAGGIVLAQDEASSAVWGMPERVVSAGLARAALPLDLMAAQVLALTATDAARTGARLILRPAEMAHAL